MENTVERLLLLSSRAVIDLGDLPEVFGEIVEGGKGPGPVGGEPDRLSLPGRVEALERQLLTEALAQSGGNQSEAARRLGIHERTLRYKLHKLGLPPGNRGED
jgi:DNA-binding NtrC family response regulator